jgi:hypothetical protein
MGRVARREWLWAGIAAGLIVAVAGLPYVTGYLAQTPRWRFAGSLMDQVDYHTYLAKMWQGYWGEWQYHLPFTVEEHDGAFLVTFYLALGHLARISHVGFTLIYHIARSLFGILMLLAVYRFISLFVPSIRTRRIVFLLASVASGLGWLTEALAPTLPGSVSPMDFWLLSGLTYLAVLVMPHFSAAIGLLLSIFVLLLRRASGPTLRDAAVALLASCSLSIIHPYALLLADAVPLLYWGMEALQTHRPNWRGILTVLAMGITQVPLVAYDVWLFTTQPVFAGWVAQNVTLSPPIHVYLLGYGVLLLLGTVGFAIWRQRGWPGLAFPVIWIGLVAVLTQVPWNLQRRFLEGVQVPLGLLAGVGLAEGLFSVPRGQRLGRRRWLVMALLISLMTMSNLYLTAGHTVAAAARDPRLFWRSELLAGIDWLGEHAEPENVVLSSFTVGNLIPARIGQQVVLGHPMETINYEHKAEAVARFFAIETLDEERTAILQRYGVDYVFYSPYEQALGAFDPEASECLVGVFAQDGVRVYAVSLPRGTQGQGIGSPASGGTGEKAAARREKR